MSYTEDLIGKLLSEKVQDQLRYLYGTDGETIEKQTKRYADLLMRHTALFGEHRDVQLISAPARPEIGGNHTDHNNGRVLAASVNLDALCAVSPRDDLKVCFHSEGYDPIEMDLTDLSVRPEEAGTTKGLIRGVAYGMKQAGYRIGGFDAAVTSTVAGGSGLSSSAALEIMLTGVLDSLYNEFQMPYVLR
ncbi:MAG: galactokinase, partial [Clostridia bacterium]|nr:galactokinase [Clostridia bacterium]